MSWRNPLHDRNASRLDIWFNEKEDENPWDYDPFVGGPTPFNSRKRKKKPSSEQSEEPETFHLDNVVIPDDGQPIAPPPVEPPKTDSTLPKGEPLPEAPPKNASKHPGEEMDFPPVFIPDNPDESTNPYAPEPAGVTASRPTSTTTSKTVRLAPAIPEYRPPSKALVFKERLLEWMPSPIVLVGIGIGTFLVLMVILLLPFLGPSPLDNSPPVAVISRPASLSVTENDRLVLDAGASHDPDGDTITLYEWTYQASEGIEIIFSEVDGSRRTRAPRIMTSSTKIHVHFIDPGEVTISLRVNDGILFSEATSLVFDIAPLSR